MKELSPSDWSQVEQSLNEKGFAHLPAILSQEECISLQKNYSHPDLYRSTINMQRYRFGKGEYKYFKYPLPSIVNELRRTLYSPLSTIANDWMEKLKIEHRYPSDHSIFIETCKSKNQLRPTPLILRYEKEGYNTLHQDLYGEVYFPFQVVFVLTQAGKDHEGGELVFIEQLPRAQSKAEVLVQNQGDAVIFTTNFRPVNGSKGFYRAKMKHGISEVKKGVRYALGIIFHDGL